MMYVCDNSRYRVLYGRRGKTTESLTMGLSEALKLANSVKQGSRAVVIAKECEPGFHYHPDNAGKFYLYQIVK